MFTRGYILRICQSYPSSAIPSDHVIWDPPKTFTTIPVRSQWGRDQLYPDHDSIVSVDYLSIFHYKYTYIYIYIYIWRYYIYIWRFPKMRVPPNHPMQSDCPEHILNPETIQLGTPIYGSSASAPFTLMWSCASTSWLREQCRRANAAACIFLLRMAVGIDPIIHPKIDIIQLHPKSVRIVVGYWWYTMVYLPPWKMMEFVRLDHHPNY